LFLGQDMGISQDERFTTRVSAPFGPATTADELLLFIFSQSLHTDLAAVRSDLQRFPAMCDTSYQTGHRLQASTFNEMVALILYQLLCLSFECGKGRETVEHLDLVVWCCEPLKPRTWEPREIRSHRDLHLIFQGAGTQNSRLARKVLDWLMDSGRLPQYRLARRLALEQE
jgi:hypothetical protein